jgi:hypothetical protein
MSDILARWQHHQDHVRFRLLTIVRLANEAIGATSGCVGSPHDDAAAGYHATVLLQVLDS